MSDLPEHVARNRVQWDAWAGQFVEPGERDWARPWPCEEIRRASAGDWP